MLCYVMLCYVMLCYVMLCYVMLCYVMLCYVMFIRFCHRFCQINFTEIVFLSGRHIYISVGGGGGWGTYVYTT